MKTSGPNIFKSITSFLKSIFIKDIEESLSGKVLVIDDDEEVKASSMISTTKNKIKLGTKSQDTFEIQRERTSSGVGVNLDIKAGNGFGTDKTGGDLNLYGGASTGGTNGGSIRFFQGSRSGSSGSNLNDWTEIFNTEITQSRVNFTGVGTLGGVSRVESNTNINLVLDYDNNGTTNYFAITDSASTRLYMPQAGNIYLKGSGNQTGLYIDSINSRILAGSQANVTPFTNVETHFTGAPNQTGKTLTLAGGAGTGTGVGGGISFGTFPPDGANAITVNSTYEEKMAMDKDGNLQLDGHVEPTGGILLDGNTITGIDDSSEFTDDDNHIMTSAAIADRFLSATGTAATAIALTSGDKTIEGNLRIGGSGDTSNNWISIDAQNGSDTTGGGITFYETGTYSVSAPQYGAKIVYNEDDDEFAIGTMHNNVFQRQIHMDRSSESVIMQNIKLETDSTNGPFVLLTKTDTSVADGDSLCRIIARSADRGSHNISQIQWFATEDHDSNSGGTKINFTVTPNGNSQSETVAMTINQDSSISIPGTIDLGGTTDTVLQRQAAGYATIDNETIITTKTTSIASGVGDLPGPATRMARRTLTTAECNALHTTPIQIVPAPGANIVALPMGGMIRVDRASTNSGSGNLDFHYEGLEPALFGTDSLMHMRRFHFNKTTDGVYNLGGTIPFGSTHATTLTEDVNKAIEVSLSSAATTNCFTSVDIYLTYQLIKIA